MSDHKSCIWNCGSTDCFAPLNWDFTSTLECKHSNGIFIDVSFWVFTKTIFYCLDCYQQLEPEEITGKD